MVPDFRCNFPGKMKKLKIRLYYFIWKLFKAILNSFQAFELFDRIFIGTSRYKLIVKMLYYLNVVQLLMVS